MTASNTRQNLRLDIQGSENVRKAGETIKRYITIKNQGQKSAKVDVWIEPSDQQSDLLKWARWSDALPIFLTTGGTCQISLQFDIPMMARPGFYNYEIRAESSAYLGEITRRSQQLEVLPSARYLEERNQPTFSVQPDTSSEHPYSLQVGQSVDVEILVENRSKQVEHFSVSCPELAAWIQGELPSLNLNPDQSGKMILQLQPPKDAIAGNYSSTLRLNLDTQSNLTFLEILYLKLEIDDRLSLSLINESPPLKANKSFTIGIANPGNIERSLEVVPQDGGKLFRYSYKAVRMSGASGHIDFPLVPRSLFNLRSRKCDTVQLSLAPQEELHLYATPKLTLNPLRRLWFGHDREVPFNVELRNANLLEEPLALPESQTGVLLWKPYPRWLIGLMILAPILILLRILLHFGYWGLWETTVKPSLLPKIAEFSTTEKIYQEEVNTPIRLKWEIRNLGSLKTVKLTRVIAPKRQSSIELAYSKKVELKDKSYAETYRLEEENIKSPEWLLKEPIIRQSEGEKYCRLVSTPIRASLLQSLWQTLYRNVPEMESYEAAKGFVLRCDRVITPTTQAGKHTFNLELEAKPFQLKQSSDEAQTHQDNPTAVVLNLLTQWVSAIDSFIVSPFSRKIDANDISTDLKTIQDAQITSAVPSSITAFSAKTTTYREAGSKTGANTAEKLPAPPILLSWTISNPTQLKTFQLSWTQVGFDGKVSRTEQPPTNFNKDVPPNFCELKETFLVCNVPIVANSAGQYTFALTVNQNPTSTKTLQNIQIRPPLPEITTFAVNGETAIDKPRQVLVLNPAIGFIDVMLNWEIPNRDRVKVELLPAPGLINSSRPSQLTYRLSPKSSNTILLRVTNQIGEAIEQSVVVETTEYVPPERAVLPSFPPLPPLPPPPGGATPSRSPTNPPEFPRDLSPYELPPKTN